MSAAIAVPTSQSPCDCQYLLYPITTSLYDGSTGITNTNVQQGYIKNVEGNKTVVSSLVVFAVPSDWAGQKCKFVFNTKSKVPPRHIDLFTSLQPITLPITGPGCKSPGSNNRNFFVGRFVVSGRGIAYWSITSDKGPDFPCPAGEIVGYELTPVYNTGELAWPVEIGSGPMIAMR